MYYDPTKGIFGNIEEALKQNQHRKNEIYNETNDRKFQIESAEQQITDNYLDNLDAQQQITDLYLQIIGG